MKKWVYAVIAVLCILSVFLGVKLSGALGKVSRLEEEAASLSETVQENEAAIEKMTAEASEKDARIRTMTEEAEAQTAEIEKMTADTADKDAQIAAVTEEAGKKAEEIDRLTAETADKDAQIAAAAAEAEKKAEEIDRLTAEAAEKDAQIAAAAAEAEKKTEEIDRLTAEAAEKDAQIAELAAEAEKKNAEIERLTAENAEKDARIRELSETSREAGGAEDLSAITQGTFRNTKRFLSLLDQRGMNYSVYPSAEGSGSPDEIVIPNISASSLNGEEYTYSIAVFFSEDDSEISFKVWNLIDFDPADLAQVQALCAELNYRWKWGKFYVDETDYSVTMDYDCVAADSPEMTSLMWNALIHVDDIVSFTYDDLIPFRK